MQSGRAALPPLFYVSILNPSTASITSHPGTEDWKEIAHGIIISLEQVENYPKESGREDDPEKEWRNRRKGIAEAEDKVFAEWMPEELMAVAKRNVKG